MDNLSLYDINYEMQKVQNLIYESLDEETGEIDPNLAKAFNELQIAKKNKLCGCVYTIKECENKIDLIKNEIERLKKLKEKLEKVDTRVRQLLTQNIEIGQKYDFDTIKLYWRKSSSVQIDDEDKFCEKYKDTDLVTTKTTYTPNKTNIKEYLKNNILEGVQMSEKQNLQIK